MKTIIIALISLGLFALPIRAQSTSDAIVGIPYFIQFKGLQPTPLHYTLYKMMELCSLRTGDYDNVLWGTSKAIVIGPSENFNPIELFENSPEEFNKARRAGIWIPMEPMGESLHGRELIVIDELFQWNNEVLTHEILHSIFSGEIPSSVESRCVLKTGLGLL